MKTEEKIWNEKIETFVEFYWETKPYQFSRKYQVATPEIVEYFDFITHYERVIESRNEKDALVATLDGNTGKIIFNENLVTEEMKVCLRIEAFLYCNGRTLRSWDQEQVNLMLDAWSKYMKLAERSL